MGREKEFGLLERGAVRLALEIQHHGLRMLSGNGFGQGGLADLARPQQRHGGKLQQATFNQASQLPLYHHCILRIT